ncbi:hypothetical protein NIIDMKKI_01000 [Mycobacterium kansasii]|uniref:Uncharacterized protein n=1 Tax=Mycobacterium kansasii TaxID=1768 RepID=A0A7G1I313_MYCKA|nr:hypothetical protein NIIDMKKI_01000 [Mycobacterium kansasii]
MGPDHCRGSSLDMPRVDLSKQSDAILPTCRYLMPESTNLQNGMPGGEQSLALTRGQLDIWLSQETNGSGKPWQASLSW